LSDKLASLAQTNTGKKHENLPLETSWVQSFLTASVLQIGCNNNDVSAVEVPESSVIIETGAVAKVGVKLLFLIKNTN
jgi:hypothetical protein